MVKRKIIYTDLAKISRLDILHYYAKRNGNKKYSDKLFLSFKKQINLLKEFPLMGRTAEFLELRFLVVSYFQIFYLVDANTIIITLFWDSRQSEKRLKDLLSVS